MILSERRIDWQIPWQFHAPNGLYIAGFPTKDAALFYARLRGWIV